MKLLFLSDTHNKLVHFSHRLPEVDFIFHSGDYSNHGSQEELENFLDEFSKLKSKYKIFIAGNHDYIFQHYPALAERVVLNYKESITYLQDSYVTIEGLTIYGSPWQPTYFNHAFNLERHSDELKSKWDKIPPKTDILLTHGPPHGILDLTNSGLYVGCELLRFRLKSVKPLIHSFGHIHERNGFYQTTESLFINATVVNKQINIEGPAYLVTLKDKKVTEVEEVKII
jgi:Icc-related predicted phosphoesterase